ncbi:MAG: mechanosensitive ion channel family protein [Verrucomicrobia bacterium]|nr:mechanosensitive ion channel family protein [Verrucomicrobiota bacterium]
MQLHHYAPLIRAVLLLVIGLPIFKALSTIMARFLKGHVSDQSVLLLSKSVLYGGSTLLLIMFMRELGFKLTTLLGAAGIAGVAIGFASQTSLSNLISGLFLIWEKPFQIGDVLNVGDSAGVVHSIDLLSVNLRTFDNRFIRIPNENLIKTSFTNVTRFPIRRMDLDIGVAYKEDVGRVTKILQELAANNPYCLDEPAPLVLFKGFGDSALEFLFGIWFVKTDFVQLRNSIMREIKERLDAEGIEIPFPHRTLYAGAATAPFPVRVVEDPAGLISRTSPPEKEQQNDVY